MKWTWIMCFTNLIHSLDIKLTKQDLNLHEFTFNVNATINHKVSKLNHFKPLSIRFIENPLYQYDKFYISHKKTWWLEPDKKQSVHSCDIFLRVSPNPWMSSIKDYPLGNIQCSLQNETLKSPPLWII